MYHSFWLPGVIIHLSQGSIPNTPGLSQNASHTRPLAPQQVSQNEICRPPPCCERTRPDTGPPAHEGGLGHLTRSPSTITTQPWVINIRIYPDAGGINIQAASTVP
jgi:hypothetical protein